MLTIRMTWPCFKWQVEATTAFFSGLYRRFVLVIARQNGKTAFLEALAVRRGLAGRRVGYFAPSYDRSEEVYGECVEALGELIGAGYVSNKKTVAGWVIRFDRDLCRAISKYLGDPNWESRRGGSIHFKSLGNPEMLRGDTFDDIIEDEAGLVEGRVHRKVLMPMIRAKRGRAILSGTPPEPTECPDPTFFRGIWERAQQDPKWYGIQRDYTCHPSIEVIEEIREDQAWMPEDEFAREYMALFPEEREHRLPMYQLWGPHQQVTRPEDVIEPTLIHTMRPHTGTGVDLADNEKDLGSKAAVITYRVYAGGIVFLLAGEYMRNPSEVLDALYIHRRLYQMDRILIQKTAFDKGFRHTVMAAEPNRGSLPVEMTNIGGSSKRRRILQMEPLARAAKIYVHEDMHEFMAEWEQFPDGLRESTKQRKRIRMPHDYDMLDAASVLVEDAMNFQMGEVVSVRHRNTADALFRALEKKAQGVRGRDLTRYYQVGGKR